METTLYEKLTEEIIGCYFTVKNKLGYGFLEKVYENALKIELTNEGFDVKQQVPIKVYYQNVIVGEYFADLLVDDKVILELKSVDMLCEEHEYQLINYLKASDIKVGLLLNFGKHTGIRRKISTSPRVERIR